MKIRIARPDKERLQSWFNDYIGQEFEVISIHDGIPRHYEVDIQHLVEKDLITDRSGGIAYVPFYFAELI